MATDLEDVLAVAATWCAEGRGVALATVVSTWGSSPRPVGSQLVVDDQGSMLGSYGDGQSVDASPRVFYPREREINPRKGIQTRPQRSECRGVFYEEAEGQSREIV